MVRLPNGDRPRSELSGVRRKKAKRRRRGGWTLGAGPTDNDRRCLAVREAAGALHLCARVRDHGGKHVCICGQKGQLMMHQWAEI